MEIKAIPTFYKSCFFRSRLEARWAAFFDLLGWRWEYEPIDLNGYIPDFILIGKDERVLVEIKPYWDLDSFKKNGVIDKTNKAIKNTDYEQYDVLYLGAVLPQDHWHLYLGWLDEKSNFNQGIGEALFSKNPQNYDFHHDNGSFRHRMDGLYDGDGYCGGADDQELLEIFNKAGSIIQWRPNGF